MMTRSSARQAGSSCGLGLGAGHGRDQRVDGRVLHAACSCPNLSVSAALLPNRSANSWPGLWVPWKADRGDVEVELLQALLVQREVHRAEAQRDAELFQVAHPGRDGAHAALVAVQVFQHHGLALGVAQGAVAVLPSRLPSAAPARGAGWPAGSGSPSVRGRLVHGAEDGGGHPCRARAPAAPAPRATACRVAAQSVLPNRSVHAR